ncbi:hypothetical protein Plim_0204 [Planctopirus limnophila DSM 3776]|uniref:Uncharacterized protein n=1 Tax=Planctopirus limnophila (strain ATCC 43296 / DSM 3776 / IFAM 1008 / Mu 290) TaxID=521674 RepID=D5SNC9_PLAL2|nr:hypothetical protein Plim_0204 [Planctopirus limnophila DSM 3776]
MGFVSQEISSRGEAMLRVCLQILAEGVSPGCVAD